MLNGNTEQTVSISRIIIKVQISNFDKFSFNPFHATDLF